MYLDSDNPNEHKERTQRHENYYATLTQYFKPRSTQITRHINTITTQFTPLNRGGNWTTSYTPKLNHNYETKAKPISNANCFNFQFWNSLNIKEQCLTTLDYINKIHESIHPYHFHHNINLWTLRPLQYIIPLLLHKIATSTKKGKK